MPEKNPPLPLEGIAASTGTIEPDSIGYTAYHRLRAQVLQSSTRSYQARGILAVRCTRCQLKTNYCVCAHLRPIASPVEFVLIMHRDELFKPTNTGRLIADCFPGQTHAFCWDRLHPHPALLALLADPARECLVIFPGDEGGPRPVLTQPQSTSRLLTLLVLDGTWKQGRRMYNLSPWLQQVPALKLNPAARGEYATRVAAHDEYLSTAESAALALSLAGEIPLGQHLFDYFAVFNKHYAAMRRNLVPPAM
ncbi:DTW domain-containing protein [Simiduia sp. 21SJ11W-1]|uniref:tRNA-uridine aminocarboxypropyltransferase n=1 Tax=Simiduia sp. 21SJ11W-1 TaxID=2909669 RepID=UPI00209C9517|nr:tRNA-uridine aminocarboxypropyltransferase [Simiduia sp. 21SJ11W-1]UTA47844.1 DTW domain-containing protein [Simiduia sp. 21SJ11W-1]